MIYNNIIGVPDFEVKELNTKNTKYCLCIPVINEGDRIKLELERAQRNNIHNLVDIIICDGGSTDGSIDENKLKSLGVNSILVKKSFGRQGSQIRMGLWWGLERGYNGFITIDGNNKDSIEDVYKFIDKLDQGYDFIQGSRYLRGGEGRNTPIYRHFAVKYIHSPIISLIAGKRYTDTTNGFRGYSRNYIEDSRVQPLRDVFISYELLAYLSVRANQLNMNTCEVPVKRIYPRKGKVPTKISPIKGSIQLIMILLKTLLGKYNPKF